MTTRICHCELSGYPEVISDEPRGKCELCVSEDAEPFTEGSVAKAFEWYKKAVDKAYKDHKNDPARVR